MADATDVSGTSDMSYMSDMYGLRMVCSADMRLTDESNSAIFFSNYEHDECMMYRCIF